MAWAPSSTGLVLEPLAAGLLLSSRFLGRLHPFLSGLHLLLLCGTCPPADLPATFRPPLAGAPPCPPDPGSLCPCHWPHWTTEPVWGCFCHRPGLPLDDLRRVQGCGSWVGVLLPLQGLLVGPKPASAVLTTVPCWALSEPPFLSSCPLPGHPPGGLLAKGWPTCLPEAEELGLSRGGGLPHS